MKNQNKLVVLGAAVLVLAGCAAAAVSSAPPVTPEAALQSSFRPKGQAGMDRIAQDEVQKLCSQYAPGEMPPEVASKIILASQASVRYPADGQYLGDWKRGETIAQTGTGFQYNDDPSKPAGGNCYACHQLSKKEIAYGTLGPSLVDYGKRGTSEPMLKYTWAKLYNADAYMACSNMPRFGHKNILTEAQLKDLMALLLDAKSPVNQ